VPGESLIASLRGAPAYGCAVGGDLGRLCCGQHYATRDKVSHKEDGKFLKEF
jgi:hypothetical protein